MNEAKTRHPPKCSTEEGDLGHQLLPLSTAFSSASWAALGLYLFPGLWAMCFTLLRISRKAWVLGFLRTRSPHTSCQAISRWKDYALRDLCSLVLSRGSQDPFVASLLLPSPASRENSLHHRSSHCPFPAPLVLHFLFLGPDTM